MDLKGKLIVIDGIDGSGKKTQTALLVERLKKSGAAVETMDFPQYDSFFGKLVGRYLNGEFGPSTEINPYLASILYAGDRWQAADRIKTWLKENKTVVLDRYYTSNLIHQSAKLPDDQLDNFTEWLNQLELEIFKIPKPDLVLFLHVDPQTSLNLLKQRASGYAGHDVLDHLAKAEQRCIQLAKKLNWRTVECCENGTLLPVESIASIIARELE